MSAAEILKSMKGAPKLDKLTYNRWSTHLLDVLSLFEIDDFILENKDLNTKAAITPVDSKTTTQDSKSSSTALDVKQDRNIRVAISQLVPDIAFHLVGPTYTAKQCWENLKQFYRPNSDEDVDDLLQEFWGLVVEDDVDIDEFVQKLAEIRGRIGMIDRDSTPSDSSMKKRVLTHFIKSCGGFYMSTVVSLRDPAITLQSAVSSLRASQAVYRELHPTPLVALVDNIQASNSSSFSLSEKHKTCAYCNRRGHLREYCFLWLDTPDGSKWAAKNPEKAKRVRMLQEKVQRKKLKSNLTKSGSDTDDSQEGIWMMEEHALTSDISMKNDDIILDTGATNHIFHDRSLFHSISPIKKSIYTASGLPIPVCGVGHVKFRVYEYSGGESSKIIEIKNVWYVPSCTKNLVSGIQLVMRGFEICTSNGGLSVLSSAGKVIASAKPKGGLFCFNTASNPQLPGTKSNVLFSNDTPKSPTELLHERFAHVGPHLLKNIDVSGFQPSIIKSGNKQNFQIDAEVLHSCEVCNLCKQVEKINRGPLSKSSVILELIHSDTWGKCRAPGIFGSLYYVTFTDDYSHETTLYLMKSKSDVPHYFRAFKEKKELQSGRCIKAMRFDGGSEYKTIDFHGITKQISAPYTQHQNGVSERLNRSLITMARCMLSHAGLPLRFWDAAVLTACYLRNRLPILQSSLTPFEVMNGYPAIISHLKVWGCICYALIDKADPQRYKLRQTSLKGIFVGYCESITQYQVYVPSKPGTNKLIISANVKFQEDSFWDWGESSREELIEDDILNDSQLLSPEDDAANNTDSEAEDGSSDIPTVGGVEVPSLEINDYISTGEHENATDSNHEETFGETSNIGNGTNPLESQPVPDMPVDSQVSNPRRSSRQRKQIEPRSAWHPKPRALHAEKKIQKLKNFLDATSGPEKMKWQAAIDEELDSLRSKEVFIPLTHIPHGRKLIGSRWVFAFKSDGRFKARLVAQGFSQVYGVDYFDTYSPTLRMDSLRILLAVSAFFDWEIHQIDVKTAYLEGDLEEDVFMRCPEGLTGTKYVKVRKALYGLKQSGRAWYQKLDEKLSNLMFRKSESDHCIYIHTVMQIVIGVYVDDLIICGKLLEQVVRVKQQLSKTFPIKDLGEIGVIIGWRITRERATRTLKISQAEYIGDKICSFGLQDAKTYTSPLNGYDGIMPGQKDEPPADESAYASAVGSLGYASNGTRPDITFAVSQLGSYNSCPVSRHWSSVCRVLRYLKGSIDYCITYSFGPSSAGSLERGGLAIYSDSDFAGDVVTRRSVSGFIVMLGGGPICWQSRRQKSVSTSTAEAEYVALCEAAKQAVWVSRLFTELHVHDKFIDSEGLLMFSDNQSALSIAGGTNSAKTKHIDVSYHFVRDCVKNKKINIIYIPTSKMLADLLTKPLPFAKANLLCQQLFRIE